MIMKKISTYHDIQLRITQKAHYAVVRKKKSQWANGPMLTQINGPFQISMGPWYKMYGPSVGKY